MTKVKTWRNKLTKGQLKHLHEMKMFTLIDFKQCRIEQKQLYGEKEACYFCRTIALRLGIEK